jgi:hypothetical protein
MARAMLLMVELVHKLGCRRDAPLLLARVHEVFFSRLELGHQLLKLLE